MKSIRSSPNPELRDSVALCFAKIASRPPCLLDFARFLLLELPEGVEDVFGMACVGCDDRDGVFNVCVIVEDCFVDEIDRGLCFGAGGEMLNRVLLPQDSHL